MILAGGAGMRLWPMSRADRPKQLIPLFEGKSLLRIAFDRLEGLIPPDNRYVCAAQKHQHAILTGVPGLGRRQFLGEPLGRDTLPAIGLAAAVLTASDPDAVLGVFTADHLIKPVDRFVAVIEQGFDLVERSPEVLVTFGIAPTGPATSFGYLELGRTLDGEAKVVDRFAEKPAAELAQEYFQQGPQRWLWNSGMFVWRASDALGLHRPLQTGGAGGVEDHRQAVAHPASRRRAGAGLSDAGADQRRFCRHGTGLARSGGHGGGDSHAHRLARRGLVARVCPDVSARRAAERRGRRTASAAGDVELPRGFRRSGALDCDDRLPGLDRDSHGDRHVDLSGGPGGADQGAVQAGRVAIRQPVRVRGTRLLCESIGASPARRDNGGNVWTGPSPRQDRVAPNEESDSVLEFFAPRKLQRCLP